MTTLGPLAPHASNVLLSKAEAEALRRPREGADFPLLSSGPGVPPAGACLGLAGSIPGLHS